MLKAVGAPLRRGLYNRPARLSEAQTPTSLPSPPPPPPVCCSFAPSQTGGTLYECGLALKAGGANSVQAFVAHGVFPKEAWKRFARVSQPAAPRRNVPHVVDRVAGVYVGVPLKVCTGPRW